MTRPTLAAAAAATLALAAGPALAQEADAPDRPAAEATGGQPAPVIRTADERLTCRQIADEAAQLSATMGGTPSGGGLGEIAKAVKRKWNSSRPNGRLALIIGEWKEEGRFVDLAFQSYTAITKYLSCYNRIQVPYSTEVHGGAYVKQAQENKETLYLCRDLMIFGP